MQYDPTHCTLCPRRCGADRTKAAGVCSGRDGITAARASLHLWELNRQVLLEAGVKEEHIFVTGLSTLKYPEFFHSYRRTGGAAGRCVGMISLVPHA